MSVGDPAETQRPKFYGLLALPSARGEGDWLSSDTDFQTERAQFSPSGGFYWDIYIKPGKCTNLSTVFSLVAIC